jgi:hypothetical protein
MQNPQFLVAPHPGEKHLVVTTIQPPWQPSLHAGGTELVKRLWAGYGLKANRGNPDTRIPSLRIIHSLLRCPFPIAYSLDQPSLVDH